MISIILPVFNEGAILHTVLRSLLAQRGVDLEILVIDGCSTDEGPAIVREIAESDPSVRLLVNEKRGAPSAFNIGLRESAGEYVAILGAHCEYEPNYIATCLSNLSKQEAAGCSGRVVTRRANDSLTATIAAAVMSNRFAVSGSSFRTQQEGYADTIPYPVFRKDVIVGLGGYNEQMVRNQDNDMNFRIRQSGARLYCTHETSCVYYARPTLRSLMQYAAQNGSWCAVSAKLEPRSLGLRHYVPLAFVLTIAAGLAGALAGVAFSLPRLVLASAFPLGLIPLHLLIGLASSVGLIRQYTLAALCAPAVILGFHLRYGLAFLIGLMKPPANIDRRAAELVSP